MARNCTPNGRHLKAAKLYILERYPGGQALELAGFGKAYSRNFSRALAKSAGLREAFRTVSSTVIWSPTIKPKRQRRQDRRALVAVQDVLEGEAWQPMSQQDRRKIDKLHRQHTPIQQLQREDERRKQRRFDEQTSLMPPEVKQQMGQCQRCGRVVPKDQLQWAFSVELWCPGCIEMNPRAAWIGIPWDER